MKALVVGASAGVGRALCEALAQRGAALCMVASDERDLHALAMHLRLLYRVDVQTIAVDAAQGAACVNAVMQALADSGRIDSVYFPIGASRADDRGALQMEETNGILNTNLGVVIGLLARLLPQLMQQPSARIVGFSSVAAIRGRRSNIVYAAAKRALESYFESLRHLTAKTGVRVQLYKLGYVATQQSFGQRLLFPAATPHEVARRILQDGDRDIGTAFFPAYWRVIALAVSYLPWRVYRELDF